MSIFETNIPIQFYFIFLYIIEQHYYPRNNFSRTSLQNKNGKLFGCCTRQKQFGVTGKSRKKTRQPWLRACIGKVFLLNEMLVRGYLYLWAHFLVTVPLEEHFSRFENQDNMTMETFSNEKTFTFSRIPSQMNSFKIMDVYLGTGFPISNDKGKPVDMQQVLGTIEVLFVYPDILWLYILTTELETNGGIIILHTD